MKLTVEIPKHLHAWLKAHAKSKHWTLRYVVIKALCAYYKIGSNK